MYNPTEYAIRVRSVTAIDGKTVLIEKATQSQLKKIYDRNQKKLVKKDAKSPQPNTETSK